MRQSTLIARSDALTDALRAANDAIGDDQPTRQAIDIIAAIKRMRDKKPARVTGSDRVDYLWLVQTGAKTKFRLRTDGSPASWSIHTPLGILECTTWRKQWRSGKLAWFSEYMLNGEPITVREIRDAGLARRPTTRNRQKKEPTK